MDIKLNFINNSNDLNNSRIVIFQKNVADGVPETAVAWKVIENCGPGANHPFVFPTTMQVSSNDSYGNYTPQIEAYPGDLLAVSQAGSGNRIHLEGRATAPTELHVRNNLAHSVIGANIHKAHRLLATKVPIGKGQRAVFQFAPTLWIGPVSQVREGQVMNAAIVSSINTELSLFGIASADIVMTGGGAGANAVPFAFALKNVVFA
jgi:hypothetical protein